MKDIQVAQIEGGIPLVGNVKVSGSRALALKIFYASVLSGEECIISNVPQTRYVLEDLQIASELDIKTTWVARNKLIVRSHDLSRFVIPDQARNVSTAAFLVPALVHKFGKAVLPKGPRAVQYADIWKCFGMEIKEDINNLYIEAAKLHSGEVALPRNSRILTDMAVITALFVLGETVILNASTDVETDDLIEYCNMMGAEVRRGEDSTIFVKGSGVFKGVSFNLPYDREEAAFFITATLLTDGNTTLTDIERGRLLPFINWLSKIGASYEFSGSDMRVWHNSGSTFEKTTIAVSPHPGFIIDFAPMAVLMSCFAQGESIISQHSSTSNLNYLKNLTQLGANIALERSAGKVEIHISGPGKLMSGKISVTSLNNALVGLLYALSVNGKNELPGYHIIEEGFEDMAERLKALGASISFDGL